MTAEEFLKKQAMYEFINGVSHPPVEIVTYDIALAALQLKEYEVITDKERKGWVCPVCGKVYAPSVTECPECVGSKEKSGYYYLYMCKRDDVLNFPTFNKEKRIFEGPFQFTEGTGFVKYQIPKEALSAHWIGLGNRSFEGIITVNVSKLSREIESDFLARFDGHSVLALVYDLKMECFFDMYDVGDISHDVHPENGKTEHIMKISTGPTCYFNYYLVPEEVDVICEMK